MTDEPLTPVQIEERMRRANSRLWENLKEHRKVAEDLGAAEADYHRRFHEAHIKSMVDEPQRTVGAHKSYAEMAAADEYRNLAVLKEIDKSLRNEAHSLRQILSALQSQLRSVGDLVR